MGGSPDGQSAPLQREGGLTIQPVGLLLSSMDANGDYLLDHAELDVGILEQWSRLDTEEQGQVTALDIIAWGERALGSRDALPNHLSFDTNMDGSISEKEFRSRLESEFDIFDRDGDGVLARADFLVNVAPAMSSYLQQFSGQAPGGGRRPQR